MRRLIRLVAGTAAVVAVAGGVFFVGMRRKSPLVLDPVRRMNKAVMNPMQLKSAGTPGAYASVLEHEGRTSGRRYRTPIVAEVTDDGFVIALPYGDRADWVRNVIAAGRATLTHEAETYHLDQPTLVPMAEVVAQFPAKDRRTHDLFGVDHALRLRRVEPTPILGK